MFSSSTQLRSRLIRDQRKLSRQLSHLDEAQHAARRTREEKIGQLKRELQLGIQAVTLPLDDIEIPAVRLERILLNEDGKKKASDRRKEGRFRSRSASTSSVDLDIIDRAFKGSRLIGRYRDSNGCIPSTKTAVEGKQMQPIVAKTFYYLHIVGPLKEKDDDDDDNDYNCYNDHHFDFRPSTS